MFEYYWYTFVTKFLLFLAFLCNVLQVVIVVFGILVIFNVNGIGKATVRWVETSWTNFNGYMEKRWE